MRMSSALGVGEDDLDLAGFIAAVATPEPLPAGVAVAAVVATLAAALAEMGAGLTLRRAAATEGDELRRVRAEAARWRAALLRAIKDDSDAYRAYLTARALPRETESARRTRQNALARTRHAAALTPLNIAGMAHDIIGFLATVAERASPALRSDLASGAILAEAAVRCATLAVRTNLRDHPDQQERDDLVAQAERLAARSATACAALVGGV
jgi:formiminotetrahydrofolate cyclodeaminase